MNGRLVLRIPWIRVAVELNLELFAFHEIIGMAWLLPFFIFGMFKVRVAVGV